MLKKKIFTGLNVLILSNSYNKNIRSTRVATQMQMDFQTLKARHILFSLKQQNVFLSLLYG